MKLIVNRRVISLPHGFAITVLTCVIVSLLATPALGGPEVVVWQSSFIVARTAIKMQSASDYITQKSDESITVKAQDVTDQDLQKHIASADLIVVGKVSQVRAMSEPSRRRPITEHDPQWRESVVEVEAVLKGPVSLKKVVILFPGTLDVAWVDVPRFKVGQQGIWIVQRDREAEAYAVVDPLDFHSRNQLDRVKQLINPVSK